MEVTKVKHIQEKVTVLRARQNGRHDESLSLEDCPDKPEKAFLDALATLAACVVARAKGCVTFKAAKPGEGKASEYFTLTGVTMSRNVNGRRQFTISCKMDLGWGEKGASLALLLEPDEEREDGPNVLSKEELAAIEALFAEGNRYAEGARETQGEMDMEDGGAAPGEEDEGDATPDGSDPFAPESTAAAKPSLVS